MSLSDTVRRSKIWQGHKLEPVKQDYIHTDLDITEICVKHGIKETTLHRRADEHGWVRLVWKRRHFKDVWNRTLPAEEALKRRIKTSLKQSKSCSGENNPMYGKPSPQGSGNGWKGRYKGHYFRSLREATFMIRMDRTNRKWTAAEGYSIPYIFEGVQRTYHPDFRVGDDLFEIKPKRLHSSPLVVAKAEVAREYCAKNGMIYHLIEESIQASWIGKALFFEDIVFAKGYRERFNNYMMDHLEETIERITKDET